MEQEKRQLHYFSFDNDNRFYCINSYKGHYRHLKHRDAKKKLSDIDQLNFDKITVNEDKIRLESSENIVIIDGMNQFLNRNYDYNIQKTHRNLNRHIRFKLSDNILSVLPINKLTFTTNKYRLKILSKFGTVVLISASLIGYSSYMKYEYNHEFVTDRIIYDAEEVKMRDYSINYNYEPQTFEIKPVNYVDFDGYTKETSLAYDLYFDIVNEEAERWGVDPHLVMAMLIQESHGNGNNIMQIAYSAWVGGRIKMYDFTDNKYVDIVFSNNKSKENETIICISAEDFRDPQMNIRMACAILRHSIDRMDNHIIAGLQNYNFGDGNMDSVINHATNDLGISKNELLAEQNNLNFANYVNYASGGDKHYINNVLKYIKDVDSLYYKDINEYGNIVEYRYDIIVKEKTK